MDNLKLRGCSSVGRALAWHARGQGVQIPSAPLKNMKKFVLETKELLFSQGIVAILTIVQIRIVAKNTWT